MDGISVQKWNLLNLRSKISIFSQEPSLFASTVIENIRMERISASDGEVFEAAKNANADQSISDLPHGCHTRIGDNGIDLSGSQN